MEERDFTREESAERNGQRDYTSEKPEPTTLGDLLERIRTEPHPAPSTSSTVREVSPTL